MKTAAVTGAVGALGLGAAHNMTPSDKAWADNDVHEVRTPAVPASRTAALSPR